MGVIAGVAAASVGSSLIGGLMSSGAASTAGSEGEAAANEAAQTQLQMYNQAVGYQTPFLNTGTEALNQLAGIYGLPTAAGPNGQPASAGGQGAITAAMNQFTQSPDYQFAQQQGGLALDRSAASKGLLLSGAQLKDAQSFGQGLATQQFGNYWNRLSQLAGFGSGAANSLTAAATTTGAGVANSQLTGGQAQMAGTVGSANALSNGLSGASNSLLTTSLVNQLSQNNKSSFNPSSFSGGGGGGTLGDAGIALDTV